MKNKDNQSLSGYELLTLLALVFVTIGSYGSYLRPVFKSEKMSSEQLKSEILAYQAAQIFLLKNDRVKRTLSRSIASEGASLTGSIGEDENGKPFRFDVVTQPDGSYEVVISKSTDISSDSAANVDSAYSLNIQPPSREATVPQ